MQQAALMAQMSQGPSTEQAAGAASQAQTQAAQQAAPGRSEGQNAPATAAGATANPIKTGVMMQDGESFNRFIQQGEIA